MRCLPDKKPGMIHYGCTLSITSVNVDYMYKVKYRDEYGLSTRAVIIACFLCRCV